MIPWLVALGIALVLALWQYIRAEMLSADLDWSMEEDDRKCDAIVALRKELEIERLARAASESLCADLAEELDEENRLLSLDRREDLRARYGIGDDDIDRILARIERQEDGHGT